MSSNRSNVFSYMEWRGDLSLSDSAFNEVDALILSVFSYLNFSCIRDNKTENFPEVVEKINSLPKSIRFNGPGPIMKMVVNLANIAAESYRFKDIKVKYFVDLTDEYREIQFGAVTFLLPDGTAFISFRGTDNTLIGWKEDLNMCFIQGIPSQLEAEKYMEFVLPKISAPIRIGGHSKGGNLSIWSACHLKESDRGRVIGIYANDAPGFDKSFLDSKEYKEIREKIHYFVPESSIVGVLMEHDDYTTIRSSTATVLQHDPFSWTIRGPKFSYIDKRTLSGRHFEKVINSWLKSMSIEERENLVEEVYGILASSDAKTLEDLEKKKLKKLLTMQKTFRKMGIKKQTQLAISISKVFFNSDNFLVGTIEGKLGKGLTKR